MKKRFKEFLNEVDHSDIDPFNEEDWEDSIDITKYQSIIEDFGYNPSDILFGDGYEYFYFTIDYPHRGNLEFIIEKNNINKFFLIMINVSKYKFLTPFWTTIKQLEKPEEKIVMDAITHLAEQLATID